MIFLQIWQFGSTDNTDPNMAMMESIPPSIDLRNCNQFSIVKLEDKRDPEGRKLVMVQTKEIGTRAEKQPLQGTGNEVQRRPSPTSTPVISNANMSVYVKRDMEHSHDLDSGIWDMVKDIDGSTRESTPVAPSSKS
jgi:hypothetical protein